jgi:Na+-translocating ferredoxin:NAD+ oxidoreductase RnfD subunit
MTERHTPAHPAHMKFRRWIRTPKGLLVASLAVLLGFAAQAEGVRLVLPGVLAASIAAMAVDVPILRYRSRKWHFPDGALLTGLIVAMVLSPHEPWWIAAVTSAVAVVSKYVMRVGKANVFNPAAFALVATFYAFDAGHSWWGSLPEAATAEIVVLFATGIFIAHRVNKLPAVLAFLGAYFLMATVMSFVGDPGRMAELYRAPDVYAALYFAFFMVTDPPTSPPKQRDQMIYGGITAVVAFLAFEVIGAAYFLLAGVLAANAWEAWRRWRLKRGTTAARAGAVAGAAGA